MEEVYQRDFFPKPQECKVVDVEEHGAKVIVCNFL